MKTKSLVAIICISLATLIAKQADAQKIDAGTHKELEKVMNDFMSSIKEQDSVKFYNLLYDGPIAWVGVEKEKSYQVFSEKDPTIKKNYFKSTPQEFIRGIITEPGKKEEKFYNVQMGGDERIASITFDYSYWLNGKKQNWGKENWALIRADGQWKITSIIFSFEMESIAPEPPLQRPRN